MKMRTNYPRRYRKTAHRMCRRSTLGSCTAATSPRSVVRKPYPVIDNSPANPDTPNIASLAARSCHSPDPFASTEVSDIEGENYYKVADSDNWLHRGHS